MNIINKQLIPNLTFPHELDNLIACMTYSTMNKVADRSKGFDYLNERLQNIVKALHQLDLGFQLIPAPELEANKRALLNRIDTVVDDAFQQQIDTTQYEIRLSDKEIQEYSEEWFLIPDDVCIGTKLRFDQNSTPKGLENREFEVTKITSGINDIKAVIADPKNHKVLGKALVDKCNKALARVL